MARREMKIRNGMTLVELLVVMVVGTFLLAASVPMLRPALEGRKIREASRQVNALFARAKSRAAELNRPAGVWIERARDLTGGAEFSVRLALAEIPPPYGGDIMNAQAQLRDFNGNGRVDGAVFSDNDAAQLRFLVNPGDKIKFGYKGPAYTINRVNYRPAQSQTVVVFGWNLVDGEPGIAGVDDDGDMTTDNLSELGKGGGAAGTDFWASPPPPERPGASVPFQIFRQPVKSSTAPIDLPGGVVLDLTNSGMGLLNRGFTPSNASDFTPVVIMFQPSGAVESISASQFGISVPPTGSIHLMLGRVEQLQESELSPLPAGPNDNTPIPFNQNLHDHRNIWVSVGHRTGMIVASENVWDWEQPSSSVGSEPTFFQQALANTREFARQAQTMGGR